MTCAARTVRFYRHWRGIALLLEISLSAVAYGLSFYPMLINNVISQSMPGFTASIFLVISLLLALLTPSLSYIALETQQRVPLQPGIAGPFTIWIARVIYTTKIEAWLYEWNW